MASWPPAEINGTQLPGAPVVKTLPAQNWTLDARAGMLLHNTEPLGSDTVGSSYTYDDSGRINQDFEGAAEWTTLSSPPTFTQSWCPGVSPPTYATVTCYSNGSRSKTYDAENRLRTETFTYQPEYGPGPTYTTTSYGLAEHGAYWEDLSGYGQPANIQSVDYSAASHPMRFALYHPDLAYPNGSPAETRAWLWDGNDRFIECHLVNGSCQTPWLSLEGLADYDLVNNALIRVNDRNRNGQVAMSRMSTAFSGWSDYPSRGRRNVYSPCSGASPDIPGAQGGICGKQHDGKLSADGWSLDYETWQGVRTFDPAIGQWNTPDAYAGEVHDPMSQKPFMWNRNNPYEYSDPTGYEGCAIQNPGACAAALIAAATSAGRAASATVGRAAIGAATGSAAGVVGLVIMVRSPAGNQGEELGAWTVASPKADMLPTGGSYPYKAPRSKGPVRPNKDGSIPDAHGNDWKWDPIKGEWDVQHRDGSHTNIGPNGEITR